MNFDRNTVIGFIALALLFFGMFYFNNQEQQAARLEQARKDSVAKKMQQASKPAPTQNNPAQATQVTVADSTTGFQQATGGEKITLLENDLLRVAFTNKGGQPKWVELKKFKGPDSGLVRLAATDFDKIEYSFNTGQNSTDSITHFYFNGGTPTNNPDGTTSISFELPNRNGNSLVHRYVLKPGNYMLDFNIQATGASQLFTNNTLYLNWQNSAKRQQKDLKYEKQQSRVCFNMDGDYDYYNIASRTEKEFDEPVKWVAVKQQFFSSALVAQSGNFSGGRMEWINPDESTGTVMQASSRMRLPLQAGAQVTVPLGIYYGPTDYKILKKYGNEMENMVDLGTGVFAFVKYINRFIIIPVFDLFAKLTSNFGIVILLLTLFIRLIISPLTYSSYLSAAKMKALRPEIEQLKVKTNGDQQAMSMEQMKLFREAGVNPLGGCIPALLQIPIFFALYSFFNSNVALRGQGFLWSDDLSVYDSILNFGHIPLISSIYGSHVSLFTITAVITSFLISLYSMSMTPDQSNPVMKYMPYFFPIILLFVFNGLPAGLTWYYTVSNLITLGLQFVIQNYIINHDKVLSKIDANRKKPKTKSKWQERFEQMQEQQKKMKEVQGKNRH
jgi:YidC/Oxa1 family membrane protein insertase